MIRNRLTEDGIFYLLCIGTDTPVVGSFESGKSNLILGAVIERNEAGIWQLIITEPQDYETESMRNYRFNILAGQVNHKIALNIENIDDNAPVIQAYNTSCSVEVSSLINRIIQIHGML